MGKRLLQISPEIIIDLCRDDRTIGEGEHYHITDGVPEGARFVRAWHEATNYDSGYINVLLEHESWPDAPEGERFQAIAPTITRIDWLASDAE